MGNIIVYRFRKQWSSTTAAIECSEKKLEIKLQKGGYKSFETSLEIKAMLQTLSKAVIYYELTTKVLAKNLKEDDQGSERIVRRSPKEQF